MRRNFIYILFWVLTVISAAAQQNNTLFLMHDLPQANIVNPAIPIKCKLYIGVPALGSTHFNAYSSGFAAEDFVSPYAGDSLQLNLQDVIDKFNNKEVIASELHLTLLTVGYRYYNNYFTFSINEKLNTYSFLPKNLLLLVRDGNTQFEGENARLDGLRVNAIHYREYAMGWAYTDNDDKFRFGLRAKLLFGKGNVYSKPILLRVNTHENSFNTYFDGSAQINSSLPIEVPTDEEGKVLDITTQDDISAAKYLMNTSNIGAGLDLGFTYMINENTTLSGSVLDLGFVRWKSDTYNYKSGGVYSINGEDNSFSDGDIDGIADSLAVVFSPSVSQNPYSAPLVPVFYLGVTRDINENINVGSVFHSEAYNNRWHPSLTFSGNAKLSKHIFPSLSYTLQNNKWTNIGAGLGIHFGIMQFHIVSDNIPAFFNLTNTRNVNLRFGLALLTACKEKRKKINALPCFYTPYR
jgi:hypothetical protein